MAKETRILAVDDSVTIRKALELILVPAGYLVEFAVNGAEAIERATKFLPDIVLLDFILPDMRGTEVCRELLADPHTRALPVVLISARGAEIRQAYHDVDNVIDYLAKPFTPDAVLGVIKEVLAAPAARTEVPAAPAGRVVQAAVTAPPLEDQAPASQPDAAPTSVGEAESAGAHDGSEDVTGERPSPRPGRAAVPHDGLEALFETLRAGLEGVYVEEMDTPVSAVADQARSYTEVAARLARQLREILEQAETGQSFRLYGDGSICSLAESLLQAYRGVCRLLFRAAAAGALADAAEARARPRLLVVRGRDDHPYERLASLARDTGEAHVFIVSGDDRRLPMLLRLYGPTHLVVDAGRDRPVWDQLEVVRTMPEGRRLRIVAVAREEVERAALAGAGADVVLPAGPRLLEAIRLHLTPARPPAEQPEEPPAMAASM